MILTPKREITKLLWYVFHLKDKARQHVIYTRSLTCELARAVPHVTIVGPWSGHTAAGALWWSSGRRGRRIACRHPALCELHQCCFAYPCHTLLWCQMMEGKGLWGETYTQSMIMSDNTTFQVFVFLSVLITFVQIFNEELSFCPIVCFLNITPALSF